MIINQDQFDVAMKNLIDFETTVKKLAKNTANQSQKTVYITISAEIGTCITLFRNSIEVDE